MESDIPLPPPPRIKQRTPFTSTAIQTPNLPFSILRKPAQSRPGNLTSHSSSDPPLFSSDDLESATMDNYRYSETLADMKRKRRYRGTWWGQEFDTKRKKTEFKSKRDMDSGVWLSSDDSIDCLISSSEEETSLPEGERLVDAEKAARSPNQNRNMVNGMKQPVQRLSESLRLPR